MRGAERRADLPVAGAVQVEALTARLARRPRRSGLFLDFDGTLAEIVDDPAESRLGDGVADVLADLVAGLGVVAVVSGRPAGFLADRVATPGVRLLGLYGLEEAIDGDVRAHGEAASWHPAVRRAHAALRDAFSAQPGVVVEDKGLSVAVHWRHATQRSAAERAVTTAVAALSDATGLVTEAGKLVVELRPPVDRDKGSVVDALADEHDLAMVCYVGDDRGDLPAFAAARARGGVAVGVVHGVETPEGLSEAVDLVLAGPAAVAGWLTALRDRLVG